MSNKTCLPSDNRFHLTGAREQVFSRFRLRLSLTVLSVCTAVFLVALSAHLVYSQIQGLKQLGSALTQTVTAFGFSLGRNYDLLTSQGELIVLDPKLHELNAEAAGYEKNSPEFKEVNQDIQERLKSLISETNADILVFVDQTNKIRLLVDSPRPAAETPVSTAPSEATFSDENVTAGPDKSAASVGDVLNNHLIADVFRYQEVRIGFMRFSEKGPIYCVSVIPALDTATEKGVLVIGELLDEAALAQWSQGMMGGILAVVNGDKHVVMAYDKRSARRPTPTALNMLEKSLTSWVPPLPGHGTINPSNQQNLQPNDFELGGSTWKEVALELNSGIAKEPVGWILFIGDTVSIDQNLHQQLFFWLVIIVVLMPLVWLSVWLLSPWFVRPYLEIPRLAQALDEMPPLPSSEFMPAVVPIPGVGGEIVHSEPQPEATTPVSPVTPVSNGDLSVSEKARKSKVNPDDLPIID